jgi:hypothetical protein
MKKMGQFHQAMLGGKALLPYGIIPSEYHQEAGRTKQSNIPQPVSRQLQTVSFF